MINCITRGGDHWSLARKRSNITSKRGVEDVAPYDEFSRPITKILPFGRIFILSRMLDLCDQT